jgi:hypothetical protein
MEYSWCIGFYREGAPSSCTVVPCLLLYYTYHELSKDISETKSVPDKINLVLSEGRARANVYADIVPNDPC